MGEVYRARAARLGAGCRDQGPAADVAAAPEALARFEREARAIAALSHASILAIFDIGSDGGHTFAVMELLEGETLRARLEAAKLSARKAVDFAVQIAQALAAAHDEGAIHRDLKPVDRKT